MRKTKIICTLGPSTDDSAVLRELMQAGMNTARLNFSHGTHEEQKKRIDMVKKLREELQLPIPILLDTKGPEVRTGNFKDGKVMLTTGQLLTLTPEELEGTEEIIPISYAGLAEDVQIGTRILIDDGLIEMKVTAIEGEKVVCRVLNGGPVSNHKSINVPDVHLTMDYMSEKDVEDIKFGISQGVDFIAASFVRSAYDVLEVKRVLEQNGGNDILIIAKIENREGVENIDEIIKAADGIMVARGDLGVEIPPSEVPYIQKMIIRKCNENYVPVITATQMLDSMIRNPRPTRAEVADVANAIYDGTDAIMLSGETAAGKYPLEALKMMVEIAQTTEPHLNYEDYTHNRNMCGESRVSSAVGLAAVQTARDLKAKAIVTPTFGGRTARLISNFRPEAPIYAVTPNDTILHRLQLVWGVTPLKGYEKDSTEHIISQAMSVVLRKRLAKKGDLIVFTVGDPATNMTREGAVTNMLHVIEAK